MFHALKEDISVW